LKNEKKNPYIPPLQQLTKSSILANEAFILRVWFGLNVGFVWVFFTPPSVID